MTIEISPGVTVYLSPTEMSLLNKILANNYVATDDNILTIKSLLAKSVLKRTRKTGVTSYEIRPELYNQITKFF